MFHNFGRVIVEDLDKKNIQQLLSDKKFDELRHQLTKTDPADVADVLDELDSDDLELVFSILDLLNSFDSYFGLTLKTSNDFTGIISQFFKIQMISSA